MGKSAATRKDPSNSDGSFGDYILTLSEIAEQYSDEEEAYKYVEKTRWANGVVSPHCGSVDHAYYLTPKEGQRKTRTGKKTYRRVWKCAACQKQFSVLVGTIFEDSRIPLSKWLLAVQEISADKNGVSSLELARKLGITQESAWFMAHRIRYAQYGFPLSEMLKGTIEADETCIGGTAKNMHRARREQVIQGRGTGGKMPVFSMVARGGDVRSQVLESVDGDSVRQPIKENVDAQAILNTDTSPVYNQV